MEPSVIDKQNAEFWNELSGTNLARSLGITEPSPENLRRFDEWYMNYYPYLGRYIYPEDLNGKRVLEIGLGYGTLGQLLALQECQYYGLDIAVNPVAMMHYRFSLLGLEGGHRVQVGSALEIPYKDASFDYVYSIGCLHHTGDLSRGISEVHRVLMAGGKAIIMLYNRYSVRRLLHVAALRLHGRYVNGSNTEGTARDSPAIRALYDANASGEAAPHTDFVSRAQARRLFRNFRAVRIDSQNFDAVSLLRGRLIVPRACFLNNLARLAGLDLYITAAK